MGSYDGDAPLLSEDSGADISRQTRTPHQILIDSVQQHPERTALDSYHQPKNLYPSLNSCAPEINEKDYLR